MPTDLRIVRTRSMIRDAFLELMETAGFAKITVDQLSKKAFISRNTFYLHYADKYALLDQLENEVLLGLKEKAEALPLDAAREKGRIDGEFIAAAQGIFAYIQEQRHFFSLILSEKGNPAFLYKFSDMVKGVLLGKIGASPIAIPHHYLVAIMSGVLTNVIREWIRGGMRETPEQITAMMATLFRDAPKNLFDT